MAVAFFGNRPHAVPPPRAGLHMAHGNTVYRHTGRISIGSFSRQGQQQRILPVACHARHAKNLPSAHIETDVAQGRAKGAISGQRQGFDRQLGCAKFPPRNP